MMQAIEFEAISEQHLLRIPDAVPEGVSLRVVLMWEAAGAQDVAMKSLFAGATEGLTADDLMRPDDRGRGEAQWDF